MKLTDVNLVFAFMFFLKKDIQIEKNQSPQLLDCPPQQLPNFFKSTKCDDKVRQGGFLIRWAN